MRGWDRRGGQAANGVFRPPRRDGEGDRLAAARPTAGRPRSSPAAGGRFSVRDAATGEERRAFQGLGLPATAAALSGDGRLLACANADGKIRLWDAAEGKPLRTLDDGQGATTLTFSTDGRFLAGASGAGNVRLWNTATGQVQEFDADGLVAQAAVAPDGHSVAAATTGGKIILWEALTGKEQRRWTDLKPVATTLAFAPDGRLLAYGGR